MRRRATGLDAPRAERDGARVEYPRHVVAWPEHPQSLGGLPLERADARARLLVDGGGPTPAAKPKAEPKPEPKPDPKAKPTDKAVKADHAADPAPKAGG